MAKYIPNRRQEQKEPEHRINDRIRATEIRLVGDNLAELSLKFGEPIEPNTLMDIRRARALAESADLDLVEISPNANPPVCRIIEYQKFLYDKKKKEKEIKAKQVKTVMKEIRFGPNTDDHDFEFKTKHAHAFLEEGSKVRSYVQFKGRSIVFKSRGEDVLLRFIAALEPVGIPEAPPKLEGRKMFVTLVPKKKAAAPTKKGEE